MSTDSWSSKILIGVVLAGVGTFFAYQTKERADIRYTLSERVPATFGGEKDAAIQQLEIKNVGNAIAEKIQVQLPSSILELVTLPHSQSLTVLPAKHPDGFEILYPSLPPEASFRVAVKARGKGVAAEEVTVMHDKGKGIHAFTKPSALGNGLTWAQVLLFPIFIWAFWTTVRDSSVASLRRKSEYEPEKLLRRRKPWSVSDETWREIREAAVKKSAMDSMGRNPGEFEAWTAVRRLNQPTIENLTDDELALFRAVATTGIFTELKSHLNYAWSEEKALPFLTHKRPAFVGAEQWKEWHDKVENEYLRIRMSRLPSDLRPVLAESPPEGMDARKWQKQQEDISEKYYTSKTYEIDRSDEPHALVETLIVPGLADKYRKAFEGRAYYRALELLPDLSFEHEAEAFLEMERPDWIDPGDYDRLKSAAERIVKGDKLRDENQALRNALVQIASDGLLSNSELEALPKETVESLQRLDKQLRARREAAATATEQRTEYADKLERIRRQLRVIADLFADPSSIERLEPYDNPFLPANLAMLKKMAQLLEGKAR